MGHQADLKTFDGLDNRREVMILLERLGTNERRAKFIESLIPSSLAGFADCPMQVRGNCDPAAAYFMLVGVCNELGVSIDEAARRLESYVKWHEQHPEADAVDASVRFICDESLGGG